MERVFPAAAAARERSAGGGGGYAREEHRQRLREGGAPAAGCSKTSAYTSLFIQEYIKAYTYTCAEIISLSQALTPC
jgi:hypothetical protein